MEEYIKTDFNLDYVECPVCKTEQTMKFYEEIDVDKNPKLRKKLLDDSLVTYKCKKCGYTTNYTFPFLYVDIENKLLVWYIDDLEGEDLQSVMKEINKLHDLEEKADKEFTFRIVQDYNDLKEKIIIKDARLDDRVIECMKVIYYSNFLSSLDDLEDKVDLSDILGIYFYQSEEREWSFQLPSISKADKLISIDFDKEEYERFADMFKNEIERYTNEGFIKIDEEFAIKVLNSHSNKNFKN